MKGFTFAASVNSHQSEHLRGFSTLRFLKIKTFLQKRKA